MPRVLSPKALRAAEQIKLTTFVFPEFPNLTFPKLPQIDSEKNDQRTQKRSHTIERMRMGDSRMGNPREIQELGECTDGDIDDFFRRELFGK